MASTGGGERAGTVSDSSHSPSSIDKSERCDHQASSSNRGIGGRGRQSRCIAHSIPPSLKHWQQVETEAWGEGRQSGHTTRSIPLPASLSLPVVWKVMNSPALHRLHCPRLCQLVGCGWCQALSSPKRSLPLVHVPGGGAHSWSDHPDTVFSQK